jgi:hypothetical protein
MHYATLFLTLFTLFQLTKTMEQPKKITPLVTLSNYVPTNSLKKFKNMTEDNKCPMCPTCWLTHRQLTKHALVEHACTIIKGKIIPNSYKFSLKSAQAKRHIEKNVSHKPNLADNAINGISFQTISNPDISMPLAFNEIPLHNIIQEQETLLSTSSQC